MSIEADPTVPQRVEKNVQGAIVQRFKEPRENLEAARAAARRHPDYMAAAFSVAGKLYPHDPKMREAFLNGTELVTALERQKEIASELTALVLMPAEPELDGGLDQLSNSA